MSGRLIECGLPRSWDAARVLRHMRRRDDVVIKAMSGTTLAGFAIMSFADDAAHLNLLAVEPHCRRMAIGRGLMTWLEKSAVCAGTFFVSLEVRVDNHGAKRFYRALGYDETDVIRGYYNGIEDAAVFARDLRVCRIA
ncbi:MAG: GNAT family N-acetyltransferase [Gammaproteobacteria bacterium]